MTPSKVFQEGEHCLPEQNLDSFRKEDRGVDIDEALSSACPIKEYMTNQGCWGEEQFFRSAIGSRIHFILGSGHHC